jgi:hypothetical protein
MPEMPQVLHPATILAHEWRTGRRVGRCIHMMVGAEPSEEDVLIAVTDDPALSRHIVELHNSALIDGPVSQS